MEESEHSTYDRAVQHSRLAHLERREGLAGWARSAVLSLPLREHSVDLLLALGLPHVHGDKDKDHEEDPARDTDEAGLPDAVEPVPVIPMVLVVVVIIFLIIVGQVVQRNVVQRDGDRDERAEADEEPHPFDRLLVVAGRFARDGRDARSPDFLGVLYDVSKLSAGL